METMWTRLRSSLRNLTSIPINIGELHQFMVMNKSWVSGFFSECQEYQDAIAILTAANRDITFLVDDDYPMYDVDRFKNKTNLDIEIMFAQIIRSRMPYFHLTWEKLYEVYHISLPDDKHESTGVAVIATYIDGSHQLLFIEVSSKYRNKGYR